VTSRGVLVELARKNGHQPRWWWTGRRLLWAVTTPKLTPELLVSRAAHYGKQADNLARRRSEFNDGLALGYRIASEDLLFLAGTPTHSARPGIYHYGAGAEDDTPTDRGSAQR
jgi:hypothetical protein